MGVRVSLPLDLLPPLRHLWGARLLLDPGSAPAADLIIKLLLLLAEVLHPVGLVAAEVLVPLFLVELRVLVFGGGPETLLTHPATIAGRFSPAERADLGVTDGLVRLSVGI